MGSKQADLTIEEGIISMYRATVEFEFGNPKYNGIFLDHKGDQWAY
jgi:hypothetical protein